MSDSDLVVESAAGDAQRRAAAAVLAEAFREDPTVSPMVATRADPVRTLADLFDFQARHHFGPYGAVDIARDAQTGKVMGAALWAAPDRWRLPWSVTVRWAPALTRILQGDVWRAGRVEAQLEAAHPRFPHWYLYAAGVDETARGRGVGTALMRHGLARADAAGMPCYLEASTSRSATLYTRLGFVRLGQIHHAPGIPSPEGMWRPALSTGM
ncbi:Mycothiol acetyltransferase [Austwickia sp. TVS 96-490-7B]|uniref:GNAT family N-acetyltransferase n=1 Tax=Austwickia sp. TVS 96-490-7B TaxID=2830843 RepID=UPI001C57156B|nr:GNAT family N-acetyltransferase [Austwickia sp. TVS 96-490-7B]MBW3085313.1 Mycothiol acetyltransferase [Austwickia sp. TVS 96-490-7B]